MPIDKPQKPSNLLPRSFGGEKNNFSDDLISNGYEVNVPQTYNGDNLNYQLDATGKELDYCEKVVDYINSLGVGKTPIVNANNKLDETQVGLKVYNATESYLLGEWVRSGDKIYQSLTQGNLGNELTNETYWEEVELGGSGYQPPLLSYQWTDHKLNDIQWLRGNTYSWHSGSVYSAVYNKLLSEYNDPNAKILINAIPVGNLTVSNSGSVRGFSSDNYLYKEINFGTTKDEIFPIVYDFTTVTSSYSSIETLFSNGYSIAFEIDTDSKLRLLLSSNGTSYNIGSVQGSTVLASNTNYKIIVDYDNTNYTLTLTNLDTNTTTTEITIASSTLVYGGLLLSLFGSNSTRENIFSGKINLAGCSIGTVWNGTMAHVSNNDYIIAEPEFEQAILEEYEKDGISWYYILDTENTRFKLPRAKNVEMHGQLVESYLDGTSGYRVYADGYCEQWGATTLTTTTTSIVTFLIPFKDLNYAGTATARNTSYLTNTNTGQMAFVPSTTTTAIVGSGVTDGALTSWFAYGYVVQTTSEVETQYNNYKKYLYFYVGDYTQDAIEQTAGLNAELFNGKADTNLANTTITPEFVNRLGQNGVSIVQTYRSGLSWWRLWSDGFLEQGGTLSTTNGSGTFVFAKPFTQVIAGFCSAVEKRWNVITAITNTGATLYSGNWNSSGGITGTKVSSTVNFYVCGWV